jgi:hypothetical protein
VVVASDTMGDLATCQSARQRYQKEFPGGVHALALAARCAAR